MDITLQVALIGALFTFFAGLLATLVNYYRERSEKERWKRTLELDERRIRHEENKWALELYNQRELELYKIRLRTYPEVLAGVGRLSMHTIEKLSEHEIYELVDKLNEWGYGEAGLCMRPDTRDAIWVLRKDLIKYAKKEVTAIQIREGSRTDLIEKMRRDLSHDLSKWRNYKPLIEVDREKVQEILARRED